MPLPFVPIAESGRAALKKPDSPVMILVLVPFYEALFPPKADALKWGLFAFAVFCVGWYFFVRGHEDVIEQKHKDTVRESHGDIKDLKAASEEILRLLGMSLSTDDASRENLVIALVYFSEQTRAFLSEGYAMIADATALPTSEERSAHVRAIVRQMVTTFNYRLRPMALRLIKRAREFDAFDDQLEDILHNEANRDTNFEPLPQAFEELARKVMRQSKGAA